jgi:hypothetical protein
MKTESTISTPPSLLQTADGPSHSPASASCLSAPAETAIAVLVAVVAFFSMVGCSSVRPYSMAVSTKTAGFVFPPVYDTIIEPLRSELVPVCKRIFFLKNEVNELKDRLWDGGSDQRIMKIDNNIDVLKKEIYALSDIRREILNAIYYVYPPYEKPEIVPYGGKNDHGKKNGKNVIVVSLEDQWEYQNARSNDENLSDELEYQPLIVTAMKKFDALPDSLKPPLQAIGMPGPVPRIRPYTPPPLYR